MEYVMMALGWQNPGGGMDKIVTTRGTRKGWVMYRGEERLMALRANRRAGDIGMMYVRATKRDAYMLYDDNDNDNHNDNSEGSES